MKILSKEKSYNNFTNAWIAICVIILIISAIIVVGYATVTSDIVFRVAGLIAMFGMALLGRCFIIIQPQEAAVFTFFGQYVGSLDQNGFFFLWNPLLSRTKLSLKARNIETNQLKVNDKEGNPIEIAGIVVYQVDDTAKALFDVENFVTFVKIQSESAVRKLAHTYPYDGETNIKTLLNATEDVNKDFLAELQERVALSGVEVIEARISHLAYSPEIAQAMLRRQQAQAIIAARATIVQGAVDITELAITRLKGKENMVLSESERSRLVSNLLIVLCSDSDTQPVLNMDKDHK